jgi:L-ascorbate metabolism protein UlaG (beta-lactamase superfamily)
MKTLYLRPDVQAEPLFDGWYAWAYLIPPATAARNITERHLRIMDSYISAPHLHASAVKNPKLLGGPFIDYGGGRVEEVRQLREQTMSSRSKLIALSGALNALDEMLATKADGYSLQPLYQEVPPVLRGYVELVYDLNNHPSFRLLESLLYRSEFYDRSAQTVLLSPAARDQRPFVLSTPRLDASDGVHLSVPFNHQIVDALFRLKREPRSWDEILDMFADAGHEKHPTLDQFFTSDPPTPYAPYEGHGVRWRYFGHACILIETKGLSILFDPVISYTYPSPLSRYTYDDLPERLDYVVITHNHQDHILFETLLQLRHKVRNIVVPRNGGGTLQDPSVKLLLSNTGFANVVELAEFEQIDTPSGSIVGLPFLGEHADLNVQSKLAYLVRIGKRQLLFAADSCNIEPVLYEHVHRCIGDVDVVFLGMECDGAPLSWLYGPLLSKRLDRSKDQSRRLSGSNFEQAYDIVRRFRCKYAYVYAMGQEPWLNHVMSIKYSSESRPITESTRLVEECRKQGLEAERLFGEKEILLPN